MTSTSAQLEKIGEDTEYACETLSDYRDLVMGLTHNKVDILGDNGEYKNTYNIIKEISKVWKEMDSMEQSALTKSLFGVRQSNVGISLIEQFDTAESVLASAIDSDNSAMTEFNKQLDSVQAKSQQLNATWEDFSREFLSEDIIKSALDGTKGILNTLTDIVKTLGTIPTIITSIVAVMSIRNVGFFRSVNSDVKGVLSNFGILGKSIKDIRTDFKQGLGARSLLNGLSKEDVANLNNYNNALKNGSTYSQAYQAHLSKSSVLAKQQGKELANIYKNMRTLEASRSQGKITEEQ